MKIKVKVMGFREMDAALSELRPLTAKNVAKRALAKGGKPIADHAIRLAHRLTGRLQESIGVKTKIANSVGNAEYHSAMQAGLGAGAARDALVSARRAKKGSSVEVYVGPGPDAPHAHLEEFGTIDTPPHPFMTPAWDAEQGEALSIISTELEADTRKAVARARRKALKAKGGE